MRTDRVMGWWCIGIGLATVAVGIKNLMIGNSMGVLVITFGLAGIIVGTMTVTEARG